MVMHRREAPSAGKFRESVVMTMVAAGCLVLAGGCGEAPADPVHAAAEMPPPEGPPPRMGALAVPAQPRERPAPRAPDAVPQPSDLRIEVLKPCGIKGWTLPIVASHNNAQFGWIASPTAYTPARLYRFALEKAVPIWLPGAAQHAEAYICGTVPGYVDPFDIVEVSEVEVERATVTFAVKHLKLQGEVFGLPSAARAYFAIAASALPPDTKFLKITFENWLGWRGAAKGEIGLSYRHQTDGAWTEDVLEDITVSIEAIRCENYFSEHREYNW